MEAPKKRPGRPPEGLGKKGEPERIRDYPRLLFTLRPITRNRLKALSEHLQRPEWRIVDEALALYFETLEGPERRAVEAIARRREKAGE